MGTNCISKSRLTKFVGTNECIVVVVVVVVVVVAVSTFSEGKLSSALTPVGPHLLFLF
jgi:hypothetical protein